MMEASVAREFESKQKGERFTLVEAARLAEKPYKPNRIAIILIGVVLGMGAAVGLASMIEFSDTSFRNAESLSRSGNFPVLTEIPVIVTKEDKHKLRRKQAAMFAGAFFTVCVAALLFDQFVMDFDVLKAKIIRNIL
ncbi:MAG: hypothetical protein GY729_20395 [Desulfobacteraceae bacterium]|nr:hypothetical protein [Desulfobacteraceae bacterium]